EVEFAGCGGLTINRGKACWYSFSAGKGGWRALDFIIFLGRGPYLEAVGWAHAWLRDNPRTGSTAGDGGGDDGAGYSARSAYASASRVRAQEIIETSTPVLGTLGEVYLRSRGLNPPYPPDCVRFLEHGRTGEHAVVGLLTANGRVAGVQCSY